MHTFVWSARDSTGRTVVREIPAETVEESKQILIASGHTDLVLKGDEIMDAAADSMRENVTFMGDDIKVTAKDRLKHRNEPPATFLRVLFGSVAKAFWLYLILGALLAYYIYTGRPIAAVGVGVAMLGWPLVVAWISLPSIYYARLNKANDWSRWTEVLSLVGKLEKLREIHFIKLPVTELGRNRAKALAGLGRLPEALESYRQFENQPGCPSWLYKAHIAGFYDTAKQHDKAIEWNRLALAEKPSTALYADLMNRLVRYRRDTAGARAALAEVEKGTLTDVARPFVARARGILAYLEGDNATARAELEASLAAMEQTPGRPGRDGSMSIARAYLACVLARQGEMAAARRQFGEARPYLIATGETELLEECNRMVGTGR
jgi:tetratricopeptide (TPR) repeat protein